MQRENQRRKTIFNIQLLIPLRVAKFSFVYELILNTGKIQLDIDTTAKLSAVIISQSGSLSKWLVTVYLCSGICFCGAAVAAVEWMAS